MATACQFDAEPIQEGHRKHKCRRSQKESVQSGGKVANTEDRKSQGKAIRPLARLLPYLARYRGLVIGSLFALTLSAAATLALPLAVRRMVEIGRAHV